MRRIPGAPTPGGPFPRTMHRCAAMAPSGGDRLGSLTGADLHAVCQYHSGPVPGWSEFRMAAVMRWSPVRCPSRSSVRIPLTLGRRNPPRKTRDDPSAPDSERVKIDEPSVIKHCSNHLNITLMWTSFTVAASSFIYHLHQRAFSRGAIHAELPMTERRSPLEPRHRGRRPRWACRFETSTVAGERHFRLAVRFPAGRKTGPIPTRPTFNNSWVSSAVVRDECDLFGGGKFPVHPSCIPYCPGSDK